MANRYSVETVFKAIDRITAPVSRMQSNVQRLTRGMSRGIRNANDTINRFGANIASVGKRAAVAATAGFAGLGLIINRVAEEADQLAKTARRLAFPIEALQQWRFVAEQSGVEVSLLESSLGAFSKRLGEARAGTGALTTFLKRANPQFLRQLVAVEDTGKAFEMYINFMGQGKTAADQAARASAAFSRAGLKMVNITHNGADAIKALRLEAVQNGLITEKQAKFAEGYNDAMNSLKKAMTGLVNEAILPLMPELTTQVRKLRDLLTTKEFRENFTKNLKDFFGDLKSVFNGLRSFFRFVRDNSTVIKNTALSLLGLVAVIKVLSGVMAIANIIMLANPLGLIVLAISALITAIGGAIIWWDELKEVFLGLPGPVKNALATLTAPIRLLADAATLIIDNWRPITGFFSDLWAGIEKTFDDAVSSVLKIVDRMTKPISTLTDGAFNLVKDPVSTVTGGVKKLFGFGGSEDNEASAPTSRQVISGNEQIARSIQENNTKTVGEVVLRDETGGKAQAVGRLPQGVSLLSSGAF